MKLRKTIAGALLACLALGVAAAPAAAARPATAPTVVAERVDGDSDAVKFTLSNVHADATHYQGACSAVGETAVPIPETAKATASVTIQFGAGAVDAASSGKLWFCTVWTQDSSDVRGPSTNVVLRLAPAGPGDGFEDAVDNDSPGDAVNVIRDYGLENAPIIVGVIGAIFLVGLTFYLIRRGLMKARGAMRL